MVTPNVEYVKKVFSLFEDSDFKILKIKLYTFSGIRKY